MEWLKLEQASKFRSIAQKIFLSMLGLGFWINQAQAFIFITYDSTGSFSRGARPISSAPKWNGNSAKFYINTDLTATGSGTHVATFTSSEFQTAVTAAIAAWNNINCKTNFKIELLGTTTRTFDFLDATSVIAYDDRASGSSQCGSATALACATSFTTRNVYSECDISVNGASGADFGVNNGGGEYDLISILIHEFGHCFGIDHPVNSSATPAYTSTNSFLNNAIMYPSIAANSLKRAITQDEIDAIQCMYAKSADTRDPCGSYHGTNNGGTISGSISGGPTQNYTPKCSNDEGGLAVTAVKSPTTSGFSACVPQSIASDGMKEKVFNWENFLYWVGGLLFLYFTKSRLRSRKTNE